jgi:hypothetical protein
MRYNSTKTDRSGNFERRLKETMDSELPAVIYAEFTVAH